jgi:hypothetical protein
VVGGWSLEASLLHAAHARGCQYLYIQIRIRRYLDALYLERRVTRLIKLPHRVYPPPTLLNCASLSLNVSIQY